MDKQKFNSSHNDKNMVDFITACRRFRESIITLKKGNLMISPSDTSSRSLSKIINGVQDSIGENISLGNENFLMKENHTSMIDNSIFLIFQEINNHLKRIDNSIEILKVDLNNVYPNISDIRNLSYDVVMEFDLTMKTLEDYKNNHNLKDKLTSMKRVIDNFKYSSKRSYINLLKNSSKELKNKIRELDDLRRAKDISTNSFIKFLSNWTTNADELTDTIEKYSVRPSLNNHDSNLESNLVQPAVPNPAIAVGVSCFSAIIGINLLIINYYNTVKDYNILLDKTARRTKSLFDQQQELIISHILSGATLSLSESLYGIKFLYENFIIYIINKVKDLRNLFKAIDASLKREDWEYIIPHIAPIVKEKHQEYKDTKIMSFTATLVTIMSSKEEEKEEYFYKQY
ncbi:hypothetical protein ID850_04235 [Xenorhabdus sp. Flor]|uniref:hypothetical protein n=1 Tax=Xenorhabdus cabanillasii TaxID=351673 RepID=UPI0019BC722C|nr:hypothetical protein [Xenorhabdus sp. Flor]MBD2813988.1 hypothetical protein [Xenorhabdus sp. Flor]